MGEGCADFSALVPGSVAMDAFAARVGVWLCNKEAPSVGYDGAGSTEYRACRIVGLLSAAFCGNVPGAERIGDRFHLAQKLSFVVSRGKNHSVDHV